MSNSGSSSTVYRVARDPWALRSPRADYRFDINVPDQPVMTLYLGESLEAALAEVLAPFRPDLHTVAALDQMPSDDDQRPATVAAYIYDSGHAGIRYGSRLAEYTCIALFVPLAHRTMQQSLLFESMAPISKLAAVDPALLKVAKDFDLHID